MSLTRTHPVLHATRDLLAGYLPPGWTVDVDPEAFTGDQVVIQPAWGPFTESFTLGDPEKATAGVQVTVRTTTRERARLTGDAIREALTAVRRGKALHPLAAPGHRFDVPATTGDGHTDTTQGIHTWVETYRIAWQFRVTPPA